MVFLTAKKIDYYNDEDINWYGVFGQLEYSKEKLSAFVSGAFNSTQMRRHDFFNKPANDRTTDWLNFSGATVKVGANYNLDEKNNIFINTGYISRAPYFDALFPTFNNDEPNEDATNEKVLAFEGGYGYRSGGFAANVNGYYTNWSNKTETIDGRSNDGVLFYSSLLGVDAVHAGVEIDFNAKLTSSITLTGFAGINNWEWKNNPNGTVTDENQNVLGESTYYIDGLKVGDAAQTTLGLGADWNISEDLKLNLQWFGFDNLYASYAPDDRDDASLQGVQALELPSYSLVDLGLSWNFEFAGMKARANANINNLFDEVYIAEAQDRQREGVSAEQRLSDTRGWYGFGRTWNAGVKVFF